jgi:hypothetical protein
MWIAAIILIGVGGLLLYFRKRTQDRLLDIRFVKTSSIAETLDEQRAIAAELGPGGYAQQKEFKGTVRCDAPLTGELSGQPCVYYTMSVEERYEETYTERDSQGNTQTRTRTGSAVVASNTQHTRFLLDDGSGSIAVDFDGASVDARKVVTSPMRAAVVRCAWGVSPCRWACLVGRGVYSAISIASLSSRSVRHYTLLAK